MSSPRERILAALETARDEELVVPKVQAWNEAIAIVERELSGYALVPLTPRGKPVPETVEGWRYQAHLMADLAESMRTEINDLKQSNNKLQQKLNKAKALEDK